LFAFANSELVCYLLISLSLRSHFIKRLRTISIDKNCSVVKSFHGISAILLPLGLPKRLLLSCSTNFLTSKLRNLCCTYLSSRRDSRSFIISWRRSILPTLLSSYSLSLLVKFFGLAVGQFRLLFVLEVGITFENSMSF
jgi:predicted DNA-binding ribbon-helix-helix protein